MVEVLHQILEEAIKDYKPLYNYTIKACDDDDFFIITLFALVGSPTDKLVLLTSAVEVDMNSLMNLLKEEIQQVITEALQILETKMTQAVEKEPF